MSKQSMIKIFRDGPIYSYSVIPAHAGIQRMCADMIKDGQCYGVSHIAVTLLAAYVYLKTRCQT